jgi:hypothetical protein
VGVGKVHVARAVRWSVRAASLGVLALAASIVVAESPVGFSVGTTVEILSAFFFLIACGGLVAGWRWEGAGGMLAVGGILLLDAVQFFATGSLPRSWTVSLVALCGFFFILSRALNVSARHESSTVLRPGSAPSPR